MPPVSSCQKGIRKVTAAKRKRKFKSHVDMKSVMLVLGLLRYFSYNLLVILTDLEAWEIKDV